MLEPYKTLDEISLIESANLPMAVSWFAVKFRALIRQSGGYLRRSHAWIASQFACSPRSIQTYLSQLEDAGLLFVGRQYSDELDRNVCNIYALDRQSLLGGRQNLPCVLENKEIKEEEEEKKIIINLDSFNFLREKSIDGLALKIGATRSINFIQSAWERARHASNRLAYFARILITGELFVTPFQPHEPIENNFPVVSYGVMGDFSPSPLGEGAGVRANEGTDIHAQAERDNAPLRDNLQAALNQIELQTPPPITRAIRAATMTDLPSAITLTPATEADERLLTRYTKTLARILRESLGDVQLNITPLAPTLPAWMQSVLHTANYATIPATQAQFQEAV